MSAAPEAAAAHELGCFSGEDVICVLVDMGFLVKRKRGAYVVMRRRFSASSASMCAVPLRDALSAATVRRVLRHAKLSAEEFLANK